MQGSQAALQPRPKRSFEQVGLVADSVVGLVGLGIRRLGGHRCPGSGELAPDALDLRTEEADRLASGAHILALVPAEALAPASDFLELTAIHKRNHSTERSNLVGKSLGTELRQRLLALLEAFEAHAAKDVLGLRELDLPVVDDLDVVPPGIAEVEVPAPRHLDAGVLKRAPGGLLVVDYEPEVAVCVGRLRPPLRERDE